MTSLLFEAIKADDPALASDFFFPREAFALVRAMNESDAYWQRLYARYVADIRALHRSLVAQEGGSAVGLDFVDLQIRRRPQWVVPGEEGNRLPYWAARHVILTYRRGNVTKDLEVRVLITWGSDWYITHLSEFR